MKRGRVSIQGMPYVPGVVQGTLRRGQAAAAPGSIAVYSPTDQAPPLLAAAGIIVVEGAPFSHAMIRLRAARVPIVFIDQAQAAQLPAGADVVLDGTRGLISDELDRATASDVPPVPEPAGPVMLADGVAVQLLASVSSVSAAQAAVSCGAGGIGLVRSEYLLPPAGQVPDETFYRAVIEAICTAAAPLSVTLRLLDVSRDKMPPWLPPIAASDDALGMHGVRLYAEDPVRRVLHAQLAALDAIDAHYTLRVLTPSLAQHEEMRFWVEYVRERLVRPLAVGAMAETPAAVLDMHHWFDTADFVAVGCNDLMQCLFGADRDRPALRAYLDPYAPALFRFLRTAADRSAGCLQRVQLCGLLSQLPGILPVLVGLGYRVFSVDAQLVPYLAQALHRLTLADATALGTQVCAAADSREVVATLGLDLLGSAQI